MRPRSRLFALVFLLAGCASAGDISEQSPTGDEPTRDGPDASFGADGGADGSMAGDEEDGARPGPATPEPDEPIDVDSFEPPPPVLAMPEAARKKLAADLDKLFAGTQHSVRIVDLDADRELYASSPDRLLKPASNTKLFTTAAALELLGPEHRFVSRVYAAAAPVQGALPSDLVVIPVHDGSTTPDVHADAAAPIREMVAALKKLGVIRVRGNVRVQGELVYGGNSLGSYDAADHRARAASAWLSTLKAAGIAVDGSATQAAGFEPPAGATLLFAWESLPTDVISSPLNVRSHNELADLLVRHVGHEQQGESSYGAGTRAVTDWLKSTGMDVTGLLLNDGSGLSHDNRVSARQVSELLRFMLGVHAGEAWWQGFSIAGVRGTLGSRLTGSDTKGRVWGKTGTLTGVIASSGILYHRHDNHRYAFAMLTNGVSDPTAMRGLLDRAVTRLAATYDGSAPVPDAPVLGAAEALAAGKVRVSFSKVDSAAGYLVWWSEDPSLFERKQSRLVDKASVVLGELPEQGTLYFRITARNAKGGESEPSDVYATRFVPGARRVLLVDANDRYEADEGSENPLGHAHTSLGLLASALAGVAAPAPYADARVDSVDNDTLLSGQVDAGSYDLLIWATGEEGTKHEPLSPAEQALLRKRAAAGRAFVLSGAEVGYDLAQGSSDDTAFLKDVLHASYVADAAGTYRVARPEPSQPQSAAALGFFTPDRMVVAYADVIAAAAGGRELLKYGDGRTAAVGFEHGAYVAFPLESLDHPEARVQVLQHLLNALDGP